MSVNSAWSMDVRAGISSLFERVRSRCVGETVGVGSGEMAGVGSGEVATGEWRLSPCSMSAVAVRLSSTVNVLYPSLVLTELCMLLTHSIYAKRSVVGNGWVR